MANWASTSYVIEGSKEDVSKVYQVIDDFMNGRKKPVAETASDSWEGNIVKTLGASDRAKEEVPSRLYRVLRFRWAGTSHRRRRGMGSHRLL